MAEPFQLSQFLPYQLAVLAERVSRRLAVEYGASHGLSVAEWRVLVHLQRCGAVSVREIQTYTNLEKSRVSRAVTRLEAAELVTKAKGGGDARLVDITLTEAGHTALTQILPTAQAVEAALLAELSDADRACFADVMERLHQVLDKDPKARPRTGFGIGADMD